MTAFILTWNENIWPYTELRKLIDRFNHDGSVDDLWRVFANRAARPGDAFVVMKQGNDPRGIFGFGKLLTTSSMQDDPAEKDGTRKRAMVHFERLIDPKKQPLLVSLDELASACPDWPHTIRGSGQRRLTQAAEDWLVKRLS